MYIYTYIYICIHTYTSECIYTVRIQFEPLILIAFRDWKSTDRVTEQNIAQNVDHQTAKYIDQYSGFDFDGFVMYRECIVMYQEVLSEERVSIIIVIMIII